MSSLLAKLAKGKKLTRAQLLALHPKKDYSDGRTKQAFRDETDINQIMKRAQVTGTISHLNKYEARYGDFAGFDFLGNQIMVAKAQTIFDALPPELRNEFNNTPGDFFDYANDPENRDDLAEKLPGLALPGRQNINALGNIGVDAENAALEADPNNEGKAAAPAANTAPAVTEPVAPIVEDSST